MAETIILPQFERSGCSAGWAEHCSFSGWLSRRLRGIKSNAILSGKAKTLDAIFWRLLKAG
jgi:hypothetical protein